MPTPAAGGASLRFVRHGATVLNLTGLRCGGDIDARLMPAGRAQAAVTARAVAALEPPVRLIVSSNLARTRETAAVIAEALPGVPTLIEPGFAERNLGQWNMLSLEQTQAWFEAGMTPPGGESEAEFKARVTAALRRLKPRLAEAPLLVASRGVGRVLGELAGMQERQLLNNAELTEFALAGFHCLATE